MSNLSKIAKAIYSAVLAALSALGGYLTNSTSLGQITAGQWVFILIAALVSGGGVYGISNNSGARGASGAG